MLSKEHEEYWKARYSEWQKDDGAQVRFVQRLDQRAQVRPAVMELLTAFLSGERSFPEFQKEFDQRTRSEWAAYGMAGPSGAMVFNKWAKHLPDNEEFETKVRHLLSLPRDVDDAVAKLGEMRAYLSDQIDAGVLRRGQVALARVSTVVSAIWMIQDSETWPGMYTSGPNMLRGKGMLGDTSKSEPRFYLEFRAIVLDLCKLLSVKSDAIGFLLYWLDAEKDRARPITTGQASSFDSKGPRIWLIGAGSRADQWPDWQRRKEAAIGFGRELGDLKQYTSPAAITAAMLSKSTSDVRPTNNALACYEFAQVMKPGDYIFVKRGGFEIVGFGVVTGDYQFQPDRGDFRHTRTVDWKRSGSWKPRAKQMSLKTLTEIGRYHQQVSDLCNALDVTLNHDVAFDDKEFDAKTTATPYVLADACRDVFMTQADIEEALEVLTRKKNIVLHGPPGVGKTFVAERLAYLLLGEEEPEQIAKVQFHQSYGYEDFVRGFRPTEKGGFTLRDGPFLKLAQKAHEDLDSPYVLIIDEINRGNMSRIFGELLTLIESDKRKEKWGVDLAYTREDNEPFFVPPNLHIIGMMNTADRSLAMVDYALRRRFGFIEVKPAFSTPAFAAFLKATGVPLSLIDHINQRLGDLNKEIQGDPGLGSGYCIGHSYFCPTDTDIRDEAWYDRVIKFEVMPLLNEYWFDAKDKVNHAETLLDFED